ncbi:hypothetical protein JW992_07430 [candidate division KSB1 bacterium]|nr:hypothetical protein [candidate division KSB1 bacterium]
MNLSTLFYNWKEWLQLWGVFYLLPGGGLSLIFWRADLKKFNWNIFDLALFVLPYLVWLALFRLGLRPKDVNNYFEVLLLSGALFGVVSLRVVVGRFSKDKNQSLLFLLLMCALAIGLYYKGFAF